MSENCDQVLNKPKSVLSNEIKGTYYNIDLTGILKNQFPFSCNIIHTSSDMQPKCDNELLSAMSKIDITDTKCENLKVCEFTSTKQTLNDLNSFDSPHVPETSSKNTADEKSKKLSVNLESLNEKMCSENDVDKHCSPKSISECHDKDDILHRKVQANDLIIGSCQSQSHLNYPKAKEKVDSQVYDLNVSLQKMHISRILESDSKKVELKDVETEIKSSDEDYAKYENDLNLKKCEEKVCEFINSEVENSLSKSPTSDEAKVEIKCRERGGPDKITKCFGKGNRTTPINRNNRNTSCNNNNSVSSPGNTYLSQGSPMQQRPCDTTSSDAVFGFYFSELNQSVNTDSISRSNNYPNLISPIDSGYGTSPAYCMSPEIDFHSLSPSMNKPNIFTNNVVENNLSSDPTFSEIYSDTTISDFLYKDLKDTTPVDCVSSKAFSDDKVYNIFPNAATYIGSSTVTKEASVPALSATSSLLARTSLESAIGRSYLELNTSLPQNAHLFNDVSDQVSPMKTASPSDSLINLEAPFTSTASESNCLFDSNINPIWSSLPSCQSNLQSSTEIDNPTDYWPKNVKTFSSLDVSSPNTSQNLQSCLLTETNSQVHLNSHDLPWSTFGNHSSTNCLNSLTVPATEYKDIQDNNHLNLDFNDATELDNLLNDILDLNGSQYIKPENKSIKKILEDLKVESETIYSVRNDTSCNGNIETNFEQNNRFSDNWAQKRLLLNNNQFSEISDAIVLLNGWCNMPNVLQLDTSLTKVPSYVINVNQVPSCAPFLTVSRSSTKNRNVDCPKSIAAGREVLPKPKIETAKMALRKLLNPSLISKHTKDICTFYKRHKRVIVVDQVVEEIPNDPKENQRRTSKKKSQTPCKEEAKGKVYKSKKKKEVLKIQTNLHKAVLLGDLEKIYCLVEYQKIFKLDTADFNVRDNGKTALDYAMEMKMDPVVNYLVENNVSSGLACIIKP